MNRVKIIFCMLLIFFITVVCITIFSMFIKQDTPKVCSRKAEQQLYF